jgi:hypothetical protein
MSKATCCIAAVALAGGVASARPVYPDPIDLDPFFASQGFTHLEIIQVTMNNDLTNLYVDIQLAGDIAATNWGKYCMLFDTKPGGVSSPSNPWGRNINTSVQSDFWMGSWVDSGGGAQLWKNNGVVWDGVEFAATYIPGSGISQSLANASLGVASYTIALSQLGLNIGDTFYFDVISTAGGTTDPGVDHLSVVGPATPNWGTASNTGPFLPYTVIPAPGAIALACIGILGASRRRR